MHPLLQFKIRTLIVIELLNNYVLYLDLSWDMMVVDAHIFIFLHWSVGIEIPDVAHCKLDALGGDSTVQ